MWYSKFLIYRIPSPIITGYFLFSGKNISPFCVRSSLSSSCMHLSFSHIDYFHKNCVPVYIFEPGNNCYIKMKCRKFAKVILNVEHISSPCYSYNASIKFFRGIQWLYHSSYYQLRTKYYRLYEWYVSYLFLNVNLFCNVICTHSRDITLIEKLFPHLLRNIRGIEMFNLLPINLNATPLGRALKFSYQCILYCFHK